MLCTLLVVYTYIVVEDICPLWKILCFHSLCQMGGWHSQTVYTALWYPLQVDSKYDEPTCDEGSPRLRDYFAIM
jgi:hypothetical protein